MKVPWYYEIEICRHKVTECDVIAMIRRNPNLLTNSYFYRPSIINTKSRKNNLKEYGLCLWYNIIVWYIIICNNYINNYNKYNMVTDTHCVTVQNQVFIICQCSLWYLGSSQLCHLSIFCCELLSNLAYFIGTDASSSQPSIVTWLAV